jgi:hypothetical protein
LVVFRHTVRTAERACFDLTRAGRHGQVGGRRMLGGELWLQPW